MSIYCIAGLVLWYIRIVDKIFYLPVAYSFLQKMYCTGMLI